MSTNVKFSLTIFTLPQTEILIIKMQ